MNLEIRIGNHSDIGNGRKQNEDYFGSYSGKFGELAIVSDGMGGHLGGVEASRIVVESIKNHFTKLDNSFNETVELEKAFKSANFNVINRALEDKNLNGMGATAVVLLIRNMKAYYGHIGDSRIYFIRDKNISLLTKDHSFVQELVDSNIITKEQSKIHPKKNIITRAIGNKDKSAPDICASNIEIKNGDIFVLCTDGLTNFIEDGEILSLTSNCHPQTAAERLIESALKNNTNDNVTVIVVKIESALLEETTDPLE